MINKNQKSKEIEIFSKVRPIKSTSSEYAISFWVLTSE